MSRTRIFFASDVHGSTKCFLKFLNTFKIYKAKVLILGGDICGKLIVPIISKKDNGWEVTFLGRTEVIKDPKKLDEVKERISTTGAYFYETSEDEWRSLKENMNELKELMLFLMKERLRQWMALCEEKLGGKDVLVFISPGNDDPYEVDEALKSSHENIITGDRRVETIDDKHSLLVLGISNKTPWNCPRDLEEAEIRNIIEELTAKVADPTNCIFSIHIPPFCSGLDVAPKLDENLRPVLGPGGGAITYHCGSTAVREAIEKHQPIAGLHGHIHESRGLSQVGRTLCFNPGSEYGEGILRGLLLEIKDGKVGDYLFTQG